MAAVPKLLASSTPPAPSVTRLFGRNREGVLIIIIIIITITIIITIIITTYHYYYYYYHYYYYYVIIACSRPPQRSEPALRETSAPGWRDRLRDHSCHILLFQPVL